MLRSCLSRTSIAAPTVVGCSRVGAILISTNGSTAASLNRFFQAKKCGAHSPRLRQNAATLCPLLVCCEINFRHFLHACFRRCVMCPACSSPAHARKMGFRYRSRYIYLNVDDSPDPFKEL